VLIFRTCTAKFFSAAAALHITKSAEEAAAGRLGGRQRAKKYEVRQESPGEKDQDQLQQVDRFVWVQVAAGEGGYIALKDRHTQTDNLSDKQENNQVRVQPQREVERTIPKLGRCPMDFEWLEVQGGYRCAGGSHFCTDRPSCLVDLSSSSVLKLAIMISTISGKFS
jgi:hypothetical protein